MARIQCNNSSILSTINSNHTLDLRYSATSILCCLKISYLFCDPFCDSIERTNWANQHASRSSRHIWVWLQNKHAALHGHELEHPAACHCFDGQRQQPYLPTFEGGAIITGTGRAKENLYELVEHCVWLKPGMRISSSCCQFRQRLHQMTH